MGKTTITRNKGIPQFNAKKSAPEVRDNLDSRKNEEQDFKGDDITHNRKPQHNKKSTKKNK
jgi:hypothetical protein